MQTLQFTRALREILTQLKAAELIAFLEPVLARGSGNPVSEGHRDQFSQLVMSSQVGFAHLLEDPATKQLLDSLKVSELYLCGTLQKKAMREVVRSNNETPGH